LPNVLDWLQCLPELALLIGTGLVAFGEAIIGVGFFLPGEAALLVASVAVGSVPEFLLLWAVATVGSAAGSVIGFALGRRMGPALRETRFIRRRGAQGWDKAAGLLHRHGTWAVFLGRLIPLVRSFMPTVAGGARMSYRTFLPPMLAGAACSTAVTLLIGLAAMAGVRSGGGVVLLVAGLLPTLVAAAIVIRRKRAGATIGSSRDPEEDPEPELEPAR
jgi:membrane-associated protein